MRPSKNLIFSSRESDLPSMISVPSNVDLAHEWVTAHAKPSLAGKGGDDALFAAACALVNGFDLDEGQAMAALMHYNACKCSPAWTDDRLRHKINQARVVAHEHKPGGLARWMLREKGLMPDAPRPRSHDAGVAPEPQRKLEGVPFDYDALLKMQRTDWQVDEEWFRERSPVDVTKCDTMSFLQHVYEPGERVLIFTKYKSQGQFIFWHGKGSFRLAEKPGVKAVPTKLPKGAPDGVWYLAQPVDGKWHENPRAPALSDGSMPLSRRAMESVTAWRFMVLECDHKEKACDCTTCNGRDNPRIHELWLNFLAQVPMPVVAIYTSAGKSVHALLRVESATKDGWDRFRKIVLRLFTKLGADPKAISAVRLTRLPGCLRGQRKQQLLYLNPRPDEAGTPIGLGGNVLCAHAA